MMMTRDEIKERATIIAKQIDYLECDLRGGGQEDIANKIIITAPIFWDLVHDLYEVPCP
jgi:hypothetical protein